MHHRAERNVPQIRRRSLIPHDAIRQHRKRLRIVAVELPCPFHTNAATAVGMVHEDEFSAIGVSFFQRGKLACLGTEGFVGGDCNGRE